MSNETLLINIDESSINRNTKSNYSWGFKGTTIEAQSSSIADSVSIIMGIWSNGSWISFISNSTINFTTFTWFLKALWSCLESNITLDILKLFFFLIIEQFTKASPLETDSQKQTPYIVYFTIKPRFAQWRCDLASWSVN